MSPGPCDRCLLFLGDLASKLVTVCVAFVLRTQASRLCAPRTELRIRVASVFPRPELLVSNKVSAVWCEGYHRSGSVGDGAVLVFTCVTRTAVFAVSYRRRVSCWTAGGVTGRQL